MSCSPLPFPKVVQIPVGMWPHAAVVSRNNFIHKSLSSWAFNIAVGCSHGCSFCYVPSAATIKQAPKLAGFGVKDPDIEWGKYVLLREWNEKLFLTSLARAEQTPASELNRDGNRAVMYCSTTDPYQVIHHPDQATRKELSAAARNLVTKSLELIRDRSTLNVRILTRSPLAKLDFDLYKSFGKRLMFGMSLPTLNEKLSRVYEPLAPSPSQRLKTLQQAKEAGLNVYVAMAPTYPECTEADLENTLTHVASLEPLTVFHEPINIRAENVTRIETRANELGVSLLTNTFTTSESWCEYALGSFRHITRIAKDLGLHKRLHLWPDVRLGSQACIARAKSPESYRKWLATAWARKSEWPK